MPPPHLTALNAQDKPVEKSPRLGWLRSAKPVPVERPVSLARSAVPAAPTAAPPPIAPERPAMRLTPPVVPPPAPPRQAAKRRALSDDDDLLADLPPAQVPLRSAAAVVVTPEIAEAPQPAPTPPPEAKAARNPAAERAYRAGRAGRTPGHAMSAAELAAWREGAMLAGRARDPIFGAPRMWWWVALALLLLQPLAYAAMWSGMPGTVADFLMTPIGREAWLTLGPAYAGWSFWVLVFGAALILQLLRPLEPVLILLAGGYWVWTGLHMAYLSGWLAQSIPPLPLPG